MIMAAGTGMAGTRPVLDDFFTRALVAGVGVALIAGPLGCFIVWRRMAYFGDTLAHSALVGAAIGLLADIDPVFTVFVVALGIAGALLFLQRRTAVGSDTLLGLLSHSALALGLVLLAFMTWVRVDLTGLLFGDILAVTVSDIAVIYAAGAVAFAVLLRIWRPLFAATVSEDLAAAEGLRPERWNFVFMALLAAVIAMAMKLVGVILITALLIIPAAAARRVAKGPEQMAALAAMAGAASVAAGLFGSAAWDTPSGPSIVAAAFALFVASFAFGRGPAAGGQTGVRGEPPAGAAH